MGICVYTNSNSWYLIVIWCKCHVHIGFCWLCSHLRRWLQLTTCSSRGIKAAHCLHCNFGVGASNNKGNNCALPVTPVSCPLRGNLKPLPDHLRRTEVREVWQQGTMASVLYVLPADRLVSNCLPLNVDSENVSSQEAKKSDMTYCIYEAGLQLVFRLGGCTVNLLSHPYSLFLRTKDHTCH